MFLKIKKIASIILISVFLANIIPCTTSAGNCFSKFNKIYSIDANSSDILFLMPHEINKLINEEKNEYINRAPDIFEFDDTLIEKVDNKILLISLMKLNYLFDKYEGFTTNFINYRRKINYKFRLRSYDDIGLMSVGLSSMNFSEICSKNYYQFWENATYSIESKFLAPCDLEHCVEYCITHEFGHLIEKTYIELNFVPIWDTNKKIKSMKKSYNDLEDLRKNIENYHNQELNQKTNTAFETTPCKNIHKEIFINQLKLSHQIYTYKKSKKESSTKLENIENKIQNNILQGLEGQNRNISAYGGQSSCEFFAEAFAHLECTDNPENVNDIGRRIESYIVNKMGYLPKENSKFNK